MYTAKQQQRMEQALARSCTQLRIRTDAVLAQAFSLRAVAHTHASRMPRNAELGVPTGLYTVPQEVATTVESWAETLERLSTEMEELVEWIQLPPEQRYQPD